MSTLFAEYGRISQELDYCQDEKADLRTQVNCAKETLRSDRRSQIYYSLLERVRSPKSSFELWPIGAILICAVILGMIVLLIFALSGFSSIATAIATFIGASLGGGAVSWMMYVPKDSDLPRRLSQARSRCDRSRTALEHILEKSRQCDEKIGLLKQRREDILASSRFEREQLLRRNWKAMRDTEWESFLADVFRSLGMEVETTNTVGDQGVDLIVTSGRRKFAIQAKGYHHSVGNSAVQEAVAGMRHYRCNSCAVITNSRFTKSAQELALSNNCLLISEEEVPQLVMGNLAF